MPRGFVPQFMDVRPQPRVRISDNEERMLNSEIEDLEHQRRFMTEDGEWNDSQQEYFDKRTTEIKARLKEIQKDKDQPIVVHTRSIRKTAGRLHSVEFKRGGTLLDSFQEKTMEGAATRFMQYLTEYQRSLTMSLWNNREGKQIDRRGESLLHILAPQKSREGIDRRSVRPKEDIVAEDGLVLDIDPDEKVVAKKPDEVVPDTVAIPNEAMMRASRIIGMSTGNDWNQMPFNDLPQFRAIVEEFENTDEF